MSDRTFDFRPTTEMGVVALFGRFYDLIGFSGILHVGTRCPDCIAVRKGRTVRVEFELRSSNFLAHRHEITQADILVCWTADADLSVETLELKSLLARFYREPLLKVGPATRREAALQSRREAVRKPSNRLPIALLELDKRCDGLEPHQFATTWGMRTAGACTALLRLVRKGLASRTDDGGRTTFRITDYGKEMADRVREARPELHEVLRA